MITNRSGWLLELLTELIIDFNVRQEVGQHRNEIIIVIIDCNVRQEMGQHMKEHKRDLIKCNVDW